MRMGPHNLRTVRKHIYGRKERQNRFLPRSQGVSKVCQLSGCPWFCSDSSSICSHSGTAVSASCGGSIRLGLMVLGEFIRTIYHEVETHESGAFDLILLCLSLLRIPSPLKRLARNEFFQASDPKKGNGNARELPARRGRKARRRKESSFPSPRGFRG